MFIIWGTKVNQDHRGTVADRCPVCADVEKFDVTDHYEVGHIYFISLGRGARVASTRVCQSCRTEFNCDPNAYDQFLPREEADAMAIDDVVETTNSQLARARDARKRLHEMASEPDERLPFPDTTHLKLPGTPLRDASASALDDELRQALSRLEAYEDSGPEVTQLLEKLQNWRRLDLAARDALLAKVDAFIDRQQQIHRAVSFIRMIAVTFPQFSGCLPALALLGALGSAFWWLPIDWTLLVYSGYTVVVLLLCCVVFYFLSRMSRRRWMRNQLIPQAEENGVDLQMLVLVLESAGQSDQTLDEKVRDLAMEVGLLQEVIVEMGKWKLDNPLNE